MIIVSIQSTFLNTLFYLALTAQGQLPQTKWFLKVVDQWYISYFGDTPDSPEYREDALKTYYQVKEQVKNYVKKHRI